MMRGLRPYLFFLLYLVLVWMACWFLLSGSTFFTTALILTACGTTVLAVYVMLTRLSGAPQSSGTSSPSPVVQEVKSLPEGVPAELTSLFAEAQRTLSGSPALASRGGKVDLRDLPVYLTIGPESSGKTATFVHADLQPQLLAGQVIRDSTVTPTPLANFWFIRNSILADVSGHAVMQGGAVWHGLLHAFRRPSRKALSKLLGKADEQGTTLRGVIVFCPATEFCGVPDPTRIGLLARTLQERLLQIGSAFRADFPVYVIFTKSDGIKYFREYCSRLTEDEASQPVGCSLPRRSSEASGVYADSENQRLSQAFNQLFYSLADWRLRLLKRETDPAKKPGVYEFPRELKRIRGAITQFLVDVFRPFPLQPRPILRGFYFTGTRRVPAGLGKFDTEKAAYGGGSEPTKLLNLHQIEEEMKRGVAAMASSEATVERPAFASRLLLNILGSNQIPVTVYRDRSVEGRAKLFLAAAAVVSVFLFCVLAGTWWANRTLLQQVRSSAIEMVQPPSSRSPRTADLVRLNNLRIQLDALERNHDSKPWKFGLFLYQGDKIIPQVRQFYFAKLQQFLLNDAVKQTKDTLQSKALQSSNPYQTIYDRLKALLMVTGDRCKVETPFLPEILLAEWLGSSAGDPAASSLARANFDFYGKELSQGLMPFAADRDPVLVAKARNDLSGFEDEKRIYAQLIESVKQSIGPQAKFYSHAELVQTGPEPNPAFSARGWSLFQERLQNRSGADTSDSCVTESKPRLLPVLTNASANDGIRAQYFQDYIAAWKSYLAPARVLPFRSASQAATNLEWLKDKNGPLLGMLFYIHTNTSFPTEPPKVSALPAAVKKIVPGLSTARDKAAQAASLLPPPGPQPTLSDITSAFQPIHTLFGASAGAENWIDDKNMPYMNALGELRKAMENIAQAHSPEAEATLGTAATGAVQKGTEVVDQIKYGFRGTRDIEDPLTRYLKDPFNSAKSFVPEPPNPGKKINGALLSFCNKSLRPLLPLFPFNSSSASSADLRQVQNVFGPDGEFALFHKQTLGNVLVRAQGKFSLVPNLPPDLNLAPAFLYWMNRMAAISQALYPEGGAHFKLAAQHNPLAREVMLSLDGKTSSEGNPVMFSWPASSQGLRLFVRGSDMTVPMASYDGAWAVYRFAAESDPRSPGQREISVSKTRHGGGNEEQLTVNGAPVTLKVQVLEFPGGVEQAFDRGFFSVQCPGRAAMNQ